MGAGNVLGKDVGGGKVFRALGTLISFEVEAFYVDFGFAEGNGVVGFAN